MAAQGSVPLTVVFREGGDPLPSHGDLGLTCRGEGALLQGHKDRQARGWRAGLSTSVTPVKLLHSFLCPPDGCCTAALYPAPEGPKPSPAPVKLLD